MWYVIPTKIGCEDSLCEWVKAYLDQRTYTRCFVARYEEVRRKEGIAYIHIQTMFPGYLFLETEYPEEVLDQLDQTSKVSALMSVGSDGKRELLPIQRGEERFLERVLDNGLLKVSYVRKNAKGEIDCLIGPLEKYGDRIEQINLHNRRAVVKIPMLREEKTIKFSLWVDKDPKIDWIETEKKRREA